MKNFFYKVGAILLQADEIGLMRLFAHLHLGPRVYATFSNGIAYEYVAGQALNYALAVDKNVYPIIAQKIGQMHRAMSSYAASDVLHPSQASTHVFHTLRNWLMMVPMRLADPANHYRMVSEMPTKATLVNELDELEVSEKSNETCLEIFKFCVEKVA